MISQAIDLHLDALIQTHKVHRFTQAGRSWVMTQYSIARADLFLDPPALTPGWTQHETAARGILERAATAQPVDEPWFLEYEPEYRHACARLAGTRADSAAVTAWLAVKATARLSGDEVYWYHADELIGVIAALRRLP